MRILTQAAIRCLLIFNPKKMGNLETAEMSPGGHSQDRVGGAEGCAIGSARLARCPTLETGLCLRPVSASRHWARPSNLPPACRFAWDQLILSLASDPRNFFGKERIKQSRSVVCAASFGLFESLNNEALKRAIGKPYRQEVAWAKDDLPDIGRCHSRPPFGSGRPCFKNP